MDEIRVNLEVLSKTEREQLLALLDGAYKRPKKFKPKMHESYWSVANGLVLGVSIWSNDLLDEARYKMGSCFETKEEAEFEAERQNVVAELENFALENNDEMDWRDASQNKFFFFYNNYTGTFRIDCRSSHQHQGTIHFSSEELCEQAIEKVGKNRIEKYIFGVEKV